MKRRNLLDYVLTFISFIPLGGMAQSYDTLWKGVEADIKMDLPKSVISKADIIYEKARTEKNIPQMMKAYIIRGNYRVELTPDSLESETKGLKEWAKTESDGVGRAVLNCILGDMAASKEDGLNDAMNYFRLSLADRQLLQRTSAQDYRPITVSGKLSRKYFGDTMYDLLVRQAIRALSTESWNSHSDNRLKSLQNAYAFFDDMIAAYEPTNRTATFLCKEAKLYFQKERLGRYTQYKLSSDEFVEKMLALADAYKDVQESADAYLKAAKACLEDNKLARAVEVARKGLAVCPKGDWTADLNKVIANAETPSLSVEFPFIYPKYETDIQVTFANLKGVTFELYRLNLPVASKEFVQCQTDELLERFGKKISTRSYSLEPSADYTNRTVTLRYTCPEAGIYVLKQMPKGVKESTPAYSLLYVSPYQYIGVPVGKKKMEVIAIDRLSGCPVPNAEVVTYHDRRCFDKVYKTDANGCAVVQMTRDLYMNVRTEGNDFMAIESVYGDRINFWSRRDEDREETTRLFIDRSIYRPGQTVHVSGLSFRQNGDTVQVLKDNDVHLELKGNGQTLGTASVTSDGLGTFSADFVLPQSLLPGNYYISANYAHRVTVRVEEYKRPTFDVQLSYTGTYVMGDTVCLQGEAKSFSGAPVRNANVKYRFSRGVRNWWRWFLSDETALAEGEAQTDGDGKFQVKVTLTRPEEELQDDGWFTSFYDYTLTADVTSGAGETQSGSLSLPVSRQSLCLDVQLPSEKIMREKHLSVQFRAMNLLRQQVDAEVTYTVYSVDKDGKKLKDVYQGTARSQQSFVPEAVWALPSGRYLIEIAAHDDQGRECKASKTFTLFSAADTQVPSDEVAWFYTDGSEFAEGTVPTLYAGTAETDVYLLLDVYAGLKRIRSERLTLNNEVKKFTFTYSPEYGDGIRAVASFVRKGQFYKVEMPITRPRPDKQLTLKWETFRDKLQPGNKEEWRMKITGPKGTPVMANLMAELYDASLDQLRPHDWYFGLGFSRPVPSVNIAASSWNMSISLLNSFMHKSVGDGLNLTDYPSLMYLKSESGGDYSTLFGFVPGWGGNRFGSLGVRPLKLMSRVAAPMASANIMESDADMVLPMAKCSALENNLQMAVEESAEVAEALPTDESTDVPVRENFAETAFFYPQLRTDSLGEVTVAFTVPDALTEWKFLGFAHTAEVDYGMLTSKTVTQKQFMVQPNMPRFVRRGDRATIVAALVNMAATDVKGTAQIELSDPASGKVVHRSSAAFSVAEGQTENISFSFDVPRSYDVLVCKITASAGEFSDGEQHYLPVLTDKQWAVETIPVQLNGEGEKTVQTATLFNGQSETATDRRLTVELTANPDWYAVQALPAMVNPQNEDALSWASAYYANSIAAHIVNGNPRIKQVFEMWKAQGANKETFLSKLEKNQDLKLLLLKESPWVLDAASETGQMQRMATLFDANNMQNLTQTAINKLEKLQNVDGSWSWYNRMQGNPFVTTEVARMLARLKTMGVTLDRSVQTMYVKALTYLTKDAKKTYEEALKWEKKSGKKITYVSERIIDYLYICAIDQTAKVKADQKVNNYFIDKLTDRSHDYTIHGKSVMAIVMQGAEQKEQAAQLIQSVKEYSIATQEMGRYFDSRNAYYSWRNYKIPTQVAAMEAICRVAPDEGMVNEMKQWLLKQKQVQAWESSLATADAVYAFLCMNGNQLCVNGKMKAMWNKGSVQTPDDAIGYTRQTFTGTDTKMNRIVISKTGKGLGWGAIYAQYQDNMDKMADYKGKGVTIARSYWKDGKEISLKNALHVGDKVTVHLTIKADRDMDFIQIKDERAACMELADQLSGYCYDNGIGYYQANHDASTEFFIDMMRKGTYQLEYEVLIDRVGTYQSGIASIQSAYSPEFGGHTSGQTLNVTE